MYDITIRTEVEDTNLIRVQRYAVMAKHPHFALQSLAQQLNMEFSTLNDIATIKAWYVD